MKYKVGVVSLGCPKNLVDSEIMLGLLKKEDFQLTNDKSEADILIVNTCGFIDTAKQESINTILEMAQCKKENCKMLIVTGCLAERYRDQILAEIPEVDAVLGTGSYGDIVKVIGAALSSDTTENISGNTSDNISNNISGNNPVDKPALYGKLDDTDYLENERLLSDRTGSAYIKIAEGCDNFCTYCVIPSLRGRYRSRKVENIVKEARWLAEKNGVKEIILVSQDTTRYGTDLYGERKLVSLIREISAIPQIKWIRLLYCYPEEIDDVLISEIANNDKVCKYLDIPIQHSSDRILKAMGRRGTSRDIINLINLLREKIPSIVLRTSLIVGFPGEEEEDFESLHTFVKEMKLEKVGVFTYSKEENTPAAKLKKQVSQKVKEIRYNKIMESQKLIAEEKNKERLNRKYAALVEGVAEDGIFYYGRTYAEAPEIDGKVYFTSQTPLETGQFVKIKILNIDEYDLIGEVTDESAE